MEGHSGTHVEGDETIAVLWKEISETQQRREKLGTIKIAFVTALLGLGSVKIADVVSVYRILYVVPLAATFFDLLIMGEHFSIRRMGAFLRYRSPKLGREYQLWVKENRDRFFYHGLFGFTVLLWGASVLLLRGVKGSLSATEWTWFIATFIFSTGTVFYGRRRLGALDIHATQWFSEEHDVLNAPEVKKLRKGAS